MYTKCKHGLDHVWVTIEQGLALCPRCDTKVRFIEEKDEGDQAPVPAVEANTPETEPEPTKRSGSDLKRHIRELIGFNSVPIDIEKMTTEGMGEIRDDDPPGTIR